jgi:endonuclease III
MQRLGYLDPSMIVADPEAVRRAVAGPPALHRYVNNVPSWIVLAARRVLDEYGGDAERIWNDQPTAEELRRRLERFQGIGQKKAAMAVEILERQRGVGITQLEGSDIAFDVHVRRVFLRTGMAERDDERHMVQRARALNAARPGALDYPAWWIGHEWCRPTEPLCDACPIENVCPKFTERAIGVSSA